MLQKRMTFKEADILQYHLSKQDNITSVKVYERTQDVVVCYKGSREDVISILRRFSYENANVPEHIWQNSGREMNRKYWDKLVENVLSEELQDKLLSIEDIEERIN